MPNEFWREVVDRVAQEAPDTLLLAEAFWLMEGYFVRTLGMHRVYNSAFMNMLKDEDNAKYRLVIKNALEFDPEILKRFVNFMNNPDEETAVAQFGKGDKYFGICTLMATMPGLPMFGHGQVEGFTEKYGMEYRRAYWDEQPDWNLVQRHEREIFPLLRRRRIFAEAEDFLLYDFFTQDGYVNEDVFAYSNRRATSAAWWSITTGSMPRTAGSAPRPLIRQDREGDDRTLVQKSLGEGLGLHNAADYLCIFRDHVTGLEYIRSSAGLCEQGLYVELGAYKYQVFLDFREVQDDAQHHYAALAASLNGRGVPSIDSALRDMYLQPIQQPFRQVVNAETFQRLLDARLVDAESKPDKVVLDEVEQKMAAFLGVIKQFTGSDGDEVAHAAAARAELEAILALPVLDTRLPAAEDKATTIKPAATQSSTALEYLQEGLGGDPATWGALFGWWAVHSLGMINGKDGVARQSRTWIDEWRLGSIIAGVLSDMGVAEPAAAEAVALVKLLTSHQDWFAAESDGAQPTARQAAQTLLADNEVQQFLRVNRYKDVLWFNKEAFETLQWWLFVVAVLPTSSGDVPPKKVAVHVAAAYSIIRKLQQAERKSGYQVDKLLAALS